MSVAAPSPVSLAAGVVSFADGPRLAAAVRSLLHQQLPDGARWTEIWLVVSPGGDGTLDVARSLARSDPRVHLVEEAERRGKSAALAEVLGRATGDYLVLLNGDAVAAQGSVASLLDARPGRSGPFAIMARPTPAPRADSLLARTIALLWDIHHAFHVEILQRGSGTHLSDEMMLLPVAFLPPMREGIVNDGAYIAQHTVERGGSLGYASDARVLISTPSSWRQHLRQRRRIARGHRQIRALTGAHPATLPRFAVAHPRQALHMVAAEARGKRGGWIALLSLAVGEVTASFLAELDDATGSRTPTIWVRPNPAPWTAIAVAAPDERTR